ncbi:MAG: tetratricopeptide repeat protein, partial [Terriglobia bacterium]
VKVLDFGVAKRIASEGKGGTMPSLESFGLAPLGTPAYMAPEVLLEKTPDGRADIFALGVVFYEMLSNGRHPFIANSVAGTIQRVLQEEPAPLCQVNPKVPEPLSQIVMRTLAKDPDGRYATAQDLLADLRTEQSGGKPILLSAPPGKSRQRKRQGAVLALSIVAVLIFIGLLLDSLGIGPRVQNWLHPQVPPQKTAGLTLPSQVNLAVMPFAPVGPDAKLTAFGNGLVESLTAKLSQLTESHSIQVIPARELRDKGVTTLQQAREEFGANLGLEVTLQQSSDLIRATYTLIDARTSRTLAASQINAPASDPFAIEDKVAEGAATALQMQLRPEEQRGLASHGTNEPAAYDYYLQGRGYLQEFKSPTSIESAIALFNQALKLDSNYGLAQAGLGMAYWTKYQLTKDRQWTKPAQTACSDAVASGNAGAEGHVCLGLLDDGTGAYQDAAEQYQRAIQLEPTSDEAYAGLALAYQHLGRLNEAEKTYQRAISLRPQYWKPYNVLGAFYLYQSEYAKAAEMFQKVIDLTPDSFRGYSNLGATQLYQGHYQDAIRPLDQSLAIRPTADTYSNIATAHFHLQEYGEAARNYLEATKLNAQDYSLWGNLGEAYYYAGKRSDAMEAYRKGMSLANGQLQVNPRDGDLLGALADYYSMMGDRKDALARLDQSLQYGRGNKDLLFNAALIYNQLGETGSALEWLQKALEAGYSKEMVRNAPALENLRKNPRYLKLIH